MCHIPSDPVRPEFGWLPPPCAGLRQADAEGHTPHSSTRIFSHSLPDSCRYLCGTFSQAFSASVANSAKSNLFWIQKWIISSFHTSGPFCPVRCLQPHRTSINLLPLPSWLPKQEIPRTINILKLSWSNPPPSCPSQNVRWEMEGWMKGSVIYRKWFEQLAFFSSLF